MGLGEKLRQAMDRLRGASALDKETVKAVVKDLQRALIAGDVDVSLVLQATKEIEKEAFGELPKGMNRREHVLKATYDRLAGLLGKAGEIPEKPSRILLVGLFGFGKCVHPKTIIPLADGRNLQAQELYETIPENEFVLEDGTVKELEKPIEVFSFDPFTLKMVRGKATHIWKLKKDRPLFKVWLDNGGNHNITVTPEHPFFAMEDGEIRKVRADRISAGCFVAAPGKIPVRKNDPLNKDFMEKFAGIADIHDNLLSERIKGFLKNEFGTLGEAHNAIGKEYAYCNLCSSLKKGVVFGSIINQAERIGLPVSLGDEATVSLRGNCARKIRVPLKMSPGLSEFLGYLYADGHMRKRYVGITNEDQKLLKRCALLGKNLFGIEGKIKKDKRKDLLFTIVFCSKTLVSFLNVIFGIPINKKSRIIRLPPAIQTSPEKCRKRFLRAFFDCDGHISKNSRTIEICTASRRFSEDMRTLLAGLSLTPGIGKKTINGKRYFRILIKARDTEWFAEEVGSLIASKSRRLGNCGAMGVGQSLGKQEMVPVGEKLKECREIHGATIGEIQKYVSAYGTYEKEGLISRSALSKFLDALAHTKNKNNEILRLVSEGADYKNILEALGENRGWLNANLFRLGQIGLVEHQSGLMQISQKGKDLLEKSSSSPEGLVKQLSALVQSEIRWIKIKKIELVEDTDYVYDLSVDEYHNFVANQVIIHNTTTTAKLANYYKKRGLKVGVIGADVMRPAAYEQLQQLSEQLKIDFYGNPKEKKAEKVVKEGVEKLKGVDLIIVDSAGRSALDSELTEEMKNIHKEFRPEHTWLILGADMGQLAGKQAQAFHDAVGVNGLVITRMDGSAKGGGALAACAKTKAPVYFIGTGEKANDLEAFDSQRYLGRIMGYGDIQGLLEKAKEAESGEIDIEAMMKGEFNLDMFYKQLKQARQIGPLNKIAEMLGISMQVPKEQLELGEEKLDAFKCIMDSMTGQEKLEPELLNSSRISRIAKGSGTKDEEVRELIKHYKQMKKMFKKMKDLNPEKMAGGKGFDMSSFGKKFGKKKKFRIR